MIGGSQTNIGSNLWANAQEYSYLTERILSVHKDGSVVLFAGGSVDALPSTMAVNAAIGMACSNVKCLLVDMDVVRNPLTSAFDLTVKRDRKVKPLKTCLDDVFIWPAEYFVGDIAALLTKLIRKARKRYGITVIYAPRLDQSPLRHPIARLADWGIIFSENAGQATRLAAVMKQANCKPIGSLRAAKPGMRA
ncbi:hypothetical protein STSP2_02130 [Anaerohalosphaera lusitana]|uniref:Uncharacterized protein n=1 Tax=Anaerohalosphaera lusitana TaxID=1936003 RepID=A0A1U9NLZ7_9BACT|nr:CpsD/CapB family tyrosine-protein kinase [Anaerohalosphaera lusitana]AQT68953.1 hypothetical protein STSP2_02130 [Anaerohalosphaera lusitana]